MYVFRYLREVFLIFKYFYFGLLFKLSLLVRFVDFLNLLTSIITSKRCSVQYISFIVYGVTINHITWQRRRAVAVELGRVAGLAAGRAVAGARLASHQRGLAGLARAAAQDRRRPAGLRRRRPRGGHAAPARGARGLPGQPRPQGRRPARRGAEDGESSLFCFVFKYSYTNFKF